MDYDKVRLNPPFEFQIVSAMTDQGNRWASVGHEIARRVDTLKLSWAELERLSGITYKTWQNYIEGAPINRKDKLRELTAVLGWTPDSIERVLDGRPPVLIDDLTGPAAETMDLDDLLAAGASVRQDTLERLRELKARGDLHAELRPALDEIGARLARVEVALSQLGESLAVRLTALEQDVESVQRAAVDQQGDDALRPAPDAASRPERSSG